MPDDLVPPTRQRTVTPSFEKDFSKAAVSCDVSILFTDAFLKPVNFDFASCSG